MPNIGDILKINSRAAFEEAALNVFAFQSRHCVPYREYLDALGVDPHRVRRFADIPHLPIEIFKSRKVYCADNQPEIVFTSSTTGGGTPSQHYVARLDDYRRTMRRAFSMFYGDPESWSFYALLPCYLERQGSSLVWMADDLIRSGGGGFFLNDLQCLTETITRDKNPNKILLGVSYALLDLAENFAPQLSDTVVMETGGMKGRRAELPKNEFHDILKKAFNVKTIHSEYGMTELMSQAYSSGDGIFFTPPWMRITIRDFNDPFDMMPAGRRGGINVTDLANLYSCAFIETQDAGILYPDGSFSIEGRMDKAQIRGCNLMAD